MTNLKDRQRVKWLFLFIIIYLPVQYGIVGIVGLHHSEPWPSFVFPGFRSVPIAGLQPYSHIDTEFHLYKSDGSEPVVVSGMELFQWVPRSQSRGFLRTHFFEPEEIEQYSPEMKLWLNEQICQTYPGRQFERFEVVLRETFYSRDNNGLRQDSVKTHLRTGFQLPRQSCTEERCRDWPDEKGQSGSVIESQGGSSWINP